MSSRVWWDAATNKQRSTQTLSGATPLHEARVLRYRGCTHLTDTPSGRFNNFFFTVLFKGCESLSYRLDTSAQLWRETALATPSIRPYSFSAKQPYHPPRLVHTATLHDKVIAPDNDTPAQAIWHDKAIALVNDTPAQLSGTTKP